jgi:hypothetical protein
MSIRFTAFLLFILGLSASTSFSAETTFINKDSLFAVVLTSTANENGDAQRLFQLVATSMDRKKVIEGNNFKVECSVEVYRCPGCNKYTCMMALKPTRKAYIDQMGIEDTILGDEAKLLYEALRTAVVEDRPGIFTKEFISLDNHTIRISAHQIAGRRSESPRYVAQIMMQE